MTWNEAQQLARMRLLEIAIVALAWMSHVTAAHAQSPYCRRVQAEARSQAYLLMSPVVTAQALHLPGVGDDTGMGLFQGAGWQPRVALSWSVLDVLRGAWVLDLAGAECMRHEARADVEHALASAPDRARLLALREELAYLEAATPAIEALVAQAEARRASQLTTQHQLNALRLRAAALERRTLEVRAQIERIEIDEPPEDLAVEDRLETYEDASMALARDESNVRRMDPWRLSVRVGLVPTESVDWFGALEVSYNLGGIAQWIAEDERVAARADELSEARYELRQRVERFQRTSRASLAEHERALELLEAQLEVIEQQVRMYAELAEHTGEMLHAWAMVELNRIELEAERRYRRRLIEEQRRITGAEPSVDEVRDEQ